VKRRRCDHVDAACLFQGHLTPRCGWPIAGAIAHPRSCHWPQRGASGRRPQTSLERLLAVEVLLDGGIDFCGMGDRAQVLDSTLMAAPQKAGLQS
jgi:hypothetical protein